ncbi:thiamine-phosphate kinase [Bacillus sonorensis]|uniref:Thiamine-monophosphate kinase n=2 Tax=Bacillus sonorensis TaxID=119858 RepID=M5P7D7_9BACI|nr:MULTISPECIES: thiamine-phosphate kinase [Bacillus]TWK84968.1 Thiamine-monophosphate kinase [Bacillus paralicheniformis]ASB90879.1 Thiamine-phosphate kinase [Bacillus sonorensis]EME75348.1 thiamine monophosphate kinase [Bacillus sonorensis L12]MBG9913778.1 thiamine monophosphate kinase [Bacillus sonorensis]MCF7616830.1 thiamine-phosphate kinase [Bacillus sonorensis]
MDEFELIRRIAPRSLSHREIEIGIGDDAAVYNPKKGYQEIVCVDTMVDGVHFLSSHSTPADIGYKALAVNISDIAAMGGYPKFYLVSIAVPSGRRESDIEAMYEEMTKLAKLYQMDLIGGDTVSTRGQMVITVTVIGEVEKGRACLRSHARPGDVVFVTGELGSSAAGLSLLLGDRFTNDEGLVQHFMKRHKRPEPRVKAGLICSRYQRVALNDISDGLASELNEIAEASRVSIDIYQDSIPTHSELHKLHSDWEEWVLFGGEDFELAGTISSDQWERFAQECSSCGVPVYKIGQVVQSGEAKVFYHSGQDRILLEKKGYNHFKQDR